MRLACRYLSEILEHVIFQTFVFNFHVTHFPTHDIEAQLSSLSKATSPACIYTRLLRIKCLNPIQGGYRPDGTYFCGRNFGSSIVNHWAHIAQSIDTHLEKAILSLRNLRYVVWNIPIDNPPGHLRELHLHASDLTLDETTIPLLKSLASLHVEGSLNDIYPDTELWEKMAGAGLKLRELSVNHLSQPLLNYLGSFSGLQKLHVRILYKPRGGFTEYDTQAFFEKILPLHGLSLTLNSPGLSSGLVFENHTENYPASHQASEYFWPVLASTSECTRLDRLTIRYFGTLMAASCSNVLWRFAEMKQEAGRRWISDLSLEPCEDAPGFHAYRPVIPVQLH
ncbi:hypothetical protein BDZ97DRAFT_1785141 [Flammula alnicola]|nr:hypothetical protein BDZ97DRAFT_1785141 [Flammula alnicola]